MAEKIITTEIYSCVKRHGAPTTRPPFHQLVPKVCEELRRLALRYMRNERAGNRLQKAALVNEVYLRPVDVENAGWRDRVNFFAVAAQMMRRILVDAARVRESAEHGGSSALAGDFTPVDLDQSGDVSSGWDRGLVCHR